MVAINKIIACLKRYWPFYLTGLIIVLGLKIVHSVADANAFDWILAPTARWVNLLSGIPFVKESQVGYVNHEHQVIIALSCSGIQFLMICLTTLLFSFIHRMDKWIDRFCWLGFSIGFSYLFTVFVNGFRIIFAIPLLKLTIDDSWMTPDRIHMIAGTFVYFISLFIIYQIAEFVSRKMAGIQKKRLNRMPPVFCYLGVTLGFPLVNRLFRNHNENFAEYVLLLTAVCLTTCALYGTIQIIQKTIKHKMRRGANEESQSLDHHFSVLPIHGKCLSSCERK